MCDSRGWLCLTGPAAETKLTQEASLESRVWTKRHRAVCWCAVCRCVVCCVGVSVVAYSNMLIQLSVVRSLRGDTEQAIWDTNQIIGVVPLKLTSLVNR